MLHNAKQALSERVINVYTTMRDGVDFNEYPDHFSSMGVLLAQIDKYESLSEILTDLLKGEYDHVGFFHNEDEGIEDFIKEILKVK